MRSGTVALQDYSQKERGNVSEVVNEGEWIDFFASRGCHGNAMETKVNEGIAGKSGTYRGGIKATFIHRD